jgi:hypothetical protein
VASFAQSATEFFAREPGLPRHTADLCTYEAALWTVSDLPDHVTDTVSEFSFERVPVLSPALRLLALRYDVHVSPEPEGGYKEGEHYLCIHRGPEEKKARPWTLNAVTFDLMQCFAAGGKTVTEAVQHVATQRNLVVDPQFLDGLCTVLADFLERGLILGSV